MKWDFIGYIFMICVKEDSVKFWSFILGCWCCLYLFCYFFIVNGIVWCCFLGKGFKLQLLMVIGCQSGLVCVWCIL